MSNPAVDTVNSSLAWVGKDFHPGQVAQCMNFTRAMLKAGKSPLADKITKSPVDNIDTGFELASSLAGRDLGELKTDWRKLTPGSPVFFNDTYSGWWPKGTVTHVGIYVGNGRFVHRPTAARPVELASFENDGRNGNFWNQSFRCGLDVGNLAKGLGEVESRPPDGNQMQAVEDRARRLKIFAHSGKIKVLSDGKEVDSSSVKVYVGKDKISVSINGAEVELVSLALDVAY